MGRPPPLPGHEHTPVKNGLPQGWEQVPTPNAIAINPRTKLSDKEENWYVEMADLPTDSMVVQNAIQREGRSGSKFPEWRPTSRTDYAMS